MASSYTRRNLKLSRWVSGARIRQLTQLLRTREMGQLGAEPRYCWFVGPWRLTRCLFFEAAQRLFRGRF